ncbi:MAG TPA: hypothetical protein VKY65_00600 [Alphaproteobacteria bacterium]|nr:hypothetical protein [Alphaproteobacteria bacterium]
MEMADFGYFHGVFAIAPPLTAGVAEGYNPPFAARSACSGPCSFIGLQLALMVSHGEY